MQNTLDYWDKKLENSPIDPKFKSLNLLKQIIADINADKVFAIQMNANNNAQLINTPSQKNISDFILINKILERMRLSINFDTRFYEDAPRMRRPYKDLSTHQENLKALLAAIDFIDRRRAFWNKIFLGFCIFTIATIIVGCLLSVPMNGAAAMSASILPIVTGSIGLFGYFATREKAGYLKKVEQFAASEENGKKPLETNYAY